LPLADGEAAAAFGLCVLDVIEKLPEAVRELARVLAPGAPFFHFLDQNPFLRTVFQRLGALGLVPLPNSVDDPCAPHWPQDLFFSETARLDRILAALQRQRHPLAEPLAHYTSVFRSEPFHVDQAILELDQLASSASLRDAVREAFRDAYRGATAS